MTSIAEIRRLIESNNITPDNNSIYETGLVFLEGGGPVDCSIYRGSDPVRANICDREWKNFNFRLTECIVNNIPESQHAAVAQSVQLDDNHWNWLTKTCVTVSTEYEWFFLEINGLPQAACLIYHPKVSALNDDNIFYIEYVAVAPWNRPNPMEQRQFKGVGKAIIQSAVKYATEELKLRYGFSLHSLPKAEAFYEHIGMLNYPILDKDALKYYEMSEGNARSYMEESG
jgi:hypothetical protein